MPGEGVVIWGRAGYTSTLRTFHVYVTNHLGVLLNHVCILRCGLEPNCTMIMALLARTLENGLYRMRTIGKVQRTLSYHRTCL